MDMVAPYKLGLLGVVVEGKSTEFLCVAIIEY